jgi:very-short-patch-repair endonuclease
MREETATVDARLASLAGKQHGVVSNRQLRELGIDKSGVWRRVRSGGLHRLYRGVYAVGYRAGNPKASWMAAVLACGTDAALSHRSAASLWGLLVPVGGPVDVSVPGTGGRSPRAGIRLHRRRSRLLGQVVERDGIRVTTPAQTIVDLRRAVPRWQWRRAVRQAEIKGLRLEPDTETDRTRSDLERDFLRLCRRYRLPAPEVNVKVGRWTVDFLWRRERVAVETDFYDYHRGRIAFQDDRTRELELRQRGLAVRRFSEEQVNDHAAEVAADLRDALGLAS